MHHGQEGPTDYNGTHDTIRFLVSQMQKVSALQWESVTVSSDFSGIGTPELTCELIKELGLETVLKLRSFHLNPISSSFLFVIM
eukprot:6465715-Amphidinium_carterae.1